MVRPLIAPQGGLPSGLLGGEQGTPVYPTHTWGDGVLHGAWEGSRPFGCQPPVMAGLDFTDLGFEMAFAQTDWHGCLGHVYTLHVHTWDVCI